MSNAHTPSKSALDLRQEFDSTFQALPPVAPVARETLLAVRVGGQPYAIKLAETAGLVTGRQIVTVPSALPELRGVAGIKGALVPVYSLAACLGHEDGDARWLVLHRSDEALAFAFTEFEGVLEVAGVELLAPIRDPSASGPEGGQGASSHIRHVLPASAGLRSVLSLESVARTIKERVGALQPPKE